MEMSEVNVPKLRFREFEGEWVEKELGKISKIKTGNKDTQDKMENGKYPFFVRSNTIERINTYSFDGEAILTAGDGVGVGKVFHYLNTKFDYHQRVYNIHNFDENIFGKYIYYYFADRFYRRVIKLSAKNSVDSVRMDMISKMIIPLPQKPEQQKIANFLTSIDQKIEQLTKKENLLVAYKKGVMQKIFSQEIRFRDENGEVYGDWKITKLSEITKINQGLQIPISERHLEKVSDSFFYITNEFLRKNSDKKYFIKNPPLSVICTKDDILMTRTGNTGQVVTGVDGAFHNNFFKIKYDKSINKDFFVYFLRLKETQNMILRLAGTSTIPDLNHGDFYKLKINLPSKAEQTKIANFLSSIDKKIEQVNRQIEESKGFKKGLLQQMFV